MKKEKNLSLAELRESPSFKDATVWNDDLQVGIRGHNELVFGPTWVGTDPVAIFEELLRHPGSYLHLDLRGFKNLKNAATKVTVEAQAIEFKDACLVFHYLNLVLHRLRHYRSWNWDFIIAIPKVVDQGFHHHRLGWVKKGTALFLPLTKPRLDEAWKKWMIEAFGHHPYSCHDLRRGVQAAAREAHSTGGPFFDLELRQQAGSWKKLKAMPSFYAGPQKTLRDLKWRELLRHDLQRLAEALSGDTGDDLIDSLIWEWDSV